MKQHDAIQSTEVKSRLILILAVKIFSSLIARQFDMRVNGLNE